MLREVQEPRRRPAAQGTQEVLSLQVLCLRQVPVDAGAPESDGCPDSHAEGSGPGPREVRTTSVYKDTTDSYNRSRTNFLFESRHYLHDTIKSFGSIQRGFKFKQEFRNVVFYLSSSELVQTAVPLYSPDISLTQRTLFRSQRGVREIQRI